LGIKISINHEKSDQGLKIRDEWKNTNVLIFRGYKPKKAGPKPTFFYVK
jgi:hypothetical protein